MLVFPTVPGTSFRPSVGTLIGTWGLTVSGSTYSKTGLRSISVRSSWGVVVDVSASGDSTSAHCMCAHACTSKFLSWVCVTLEHQHL